jgi:signal transduction histidine kinase
MANEANERAEEGARPSRNALWVSAGALLATLALIGLIFLIAWSNRARDDALGWERRTYDIMMRTRLIDASIARSEAALGRYVLDENQHTGTDYYNEWRNADYQISQIQRLLARDPDQTRRVRELRRLFEQRNDELSPAASAAERRTGSGGISLLYQAASSQTLPRLRAELDAISSAERASLNERMQQTQIFVERADKYTEWLGWLAILIGLGAVGLAILAWRAFLDSVRARREADSEAWRALGLEQAVEARTAELRHANNQLQAEMIERAAAEAQLRQVQKMEAVGQLTGGIAHDFNNMLAVVVGGLDLAKRKLHGPRREVEFHLDNAMEGATRAAALTRRLLAFARAEPLMPEAITPSELIEGMLELIDRAIGERIQVTTRFAETPWAVFADTTRLENAILNLAVNARDAMPEGGALTIAVDNIQAGDREIDDLPAGDYVRVSVADTGAGISPENLERVFEPFFTTKPVGKGTGLGLSQMFGFARQSGGHAAIESTLGAGTTVSLFLPRHLANAGEAAAAPAARHDPEAVPAASAAHRGARILVVEDDPRVARSTIGALEELGYHTLAAAGGAEALGLLGSEPDIALVITDVMMPEMTGTELAAAIRPDWPDLPILFVTGYVGEAGDGLAGGEVLRKPFTVAALAAAVATALAVSAPPLAARDAAAE